VCERRRVAENGVGVCCKTAVGRKINYFGISREPNVRIIKIDIIFADAWPHLVTTTFHLCFPYLYNDTQDNDTQHNDTQDNDIQHNDIQHNDIQHNDIQHNDTQHNDIQHNDTQHNDIQHNDTQHNDSQDNNTQHRRITLSIMALNTFIMSVVNAECC
jgi:hypothetical protein